MLQQNLINYGRQKSDKYMYIAQHFYIEPL